MPEALALLLVFVIAVFAYASARLHAANPANYSAHGERARLRLYRASLQERLQVAKRENWDPAMLDQIFEELESAEAQLVQTTPIANDAAKTLSTHE